MASSDTSHPLSLSPTKGFHSKKTLSDALDRLAGIVPPVRIACLTLRMLLDSSLRQDWDDIKSESTSLLSNAAIATFLAAVQSQIIALSYQDNASHVAVACNVLGFAGVLFDVSSACFALGASTTLQRYTTIIDNEINAIDDASPRQLAQMDLAPVHGDAYGVSDIWLRIHKKVEMRMRILRNEQNPSQGHETSIVDRGQPLLRASQESWKEVQGALAVATAASNLMILGVLCFFGSIICLAVATQPRAVWIVSVVVTAWVILAVLIASVVLAAKRFWNRLRGLW
ncbi:hypothetical protein R3P38DRAFT_2720401 [Favolaschia claudopus]|uniref:Uncharacterized protein n=1 Tax=Favolaschia claudopus TaxID=2862362 RepID=A0AAW0ALB8_9AGAR